MSSRSTSARLRPTSARVAASAACAALAAGAGGRDARIGVAFWWHDSVRADFGSFSQQHGAVDGVFEFAHIAAPGIGKQHALGVVRKGALRQPVHIGVFLRKEASELYDVACALTKRRNTQIDDVEAIEKVLAERPFAHGLTKVAIRGCDNADVDRHRLRAADSGR